MPWEDAGSCWEEPKRGPLEDVDHIIFNCCFFIRRDTSGVAKKDHAELLCCQAVVCFGKGEKMCEQ